MSVLLGLMNRGEYDPIVEDELDQLVAAIQTAFNTETSAPGSVGDWSVGEDLTVEGNATITGALTVAGATTLTGALAVEGLATFSAGLSATGPVYINDTSNANNDKGLTILQPALVEDQILTFKYATLATGLSTVLTPDVETDDYASFSMTDGTGSHFGGLRVASLMRDTGLDTNLLFEAVGGQADTGKSSGSRSLIEFYASQHDGANALEDLTANGNVFGVRARTGGADATVFLVDTLSNIHLFGGGIITRVAFGRRSPSYFGDTSNANNTEGVTIFHSTNPLDQILTLKHNNVATGLTSAAEVALETDDFGAFQAVAATTGGLRILGVGENAAVTTNVALSSYGGQASTTKSTSGRSLVEVYASQHDGANALSNIAADGNVFGVRARVGAADTTVAIVDEDGDLWLNGTITPVGGQIVFPDTQVASSSANTLDDYEEGTWTPVLTFSTPGDQSIAYSTQNGSYTKIGREVRVSVRIVTSTFTHTTAAGSLQITGLPFTSASLTINYPGAIQITGFTFGAGYTNYCVTIGASSTTMGLSKNGSGVSNADFAVGDHVSGTTVAVIGSTVYAASA